MSQPSYLPPELHTKKGMEEYMGTKGLKDFILTCPDTFDPRSVLAKAVFTGTISVETLFPSGEMADSVKKLTRVGDGNTIVPLWVFLLLHLVENLDSFRTKYENSTTISKRNTIVDEIANFYGSYGITVIRMIGGSFKEISIEVDDKAPLLTEVSLVKFLQDSATKKQFLGKCGELLERNKYLSGGGVWEHDNDLPDCWLVDDDLTLLRGGQEVLKYLYATQTVKNVLTYNNFSVPIILSGESGGGKTCALLVAGGKHDVNIATLASIVVMSFEVVEGEKKQNEDNMVKHIDTYVTNKLQPMLKQFNNPDAVDAVLNVMLHLDEVAFSCHEKIRILIHAAHRLHSAHEAPNCPMKLSIHIAMAGTGLSGLLNCAPGSLAGKFYMIPVEPPAPAELREIVTLHMGKSRVDAVMAQREFKTVVATNMRLLSYTLRALLPVLVLPTEVSDPRDRALLDDIRRHVRGPADDPPVVRFSDPASITHALRYACAVGAINFVNANGLSSLHKELRLELLHMAHAAYLQRVVFYHGDAEVRKRLEAAGFTPFFRDAEDEKDAKRRVVVKALRKAEELGVFTTTEQERIFPTTGAAEWLQTTPSKEGVAMAVPAGRPPIQMSPAYRMLPRLLSGTLFSKGSPQDFEELLTELCFEGLVAARGRCSYATLLAAVCGPEYALGASTAEHTLLDEALRTDDVDVTVLAAALSGVLDEPGAADVAEGLTPALVAAEGAVRDLLRGGAGELQEAVEQQLYKHLHSPEGAPSKVSRGRVRSRESSELEGESEEIPQKRVRTEKVDYASVLCEPHLQRKVESTLQKYSVQQLARNVTSALVVASKRQHSFKDCRRHAMQEQTKGNENNQQPQSVSKKACRPGQSSDLKAKVANETSKRCEQTTTSTDGQPCFEYTHVVKVVLDFTLRQDTDYYVAVAVACARALQEQYPDTMEKLLQTHFLGMPLEGVLGFVEEVYAANEEAADPDLSAFVEQTLKCLLMNKMFVLVPAERSPSADAIIMCVSDKTPFLAGLQYKRYTSKPVTPAMFQKELGKMSKGHLSMQSLMRLSGAKAVECFFGLYQEQTFMPTGRIGDQTVHTFVRSDGNDFFKLTTDKQ